MTFTEEQLASEEWRPVVGWEDTYEISNLLRVRSIPRTITKIDGETAEYSYRYMTERIGGYGHLHVRLYRNRVGSWHPVYDYYAEAFNKSRDDALEVEQGILSQVALDDNRVVFDFENDLPGEEWRYIDGYNNEYQISSEGRVRLSDESLTKNQSMTHNKPSRILSKCVTKSGRQVVVLSNKSGKKRHFVDALVANAFLKRPDGGYFLEHVNGDESDCRLENIKWVELHPDIDVSSLYDDHGIEEWRPVVGWEDLYLVSSWGRIRSLDRVYVDRNGRKVPRHGEMLSIKTDGQGYVMVALTRDKNVTYVGVHRLVAEAFLDKPGGDYEVDHISGVRNDNRAANLRYCTRAENVRNRVLDGSRKTVNEHAPETHTKDLPGEEWRDLEGHEGYQVSSCGRIRSQEMTVNSSLGRRAISGRVMRLAKVSSGRMVVYLNRPNKCSVYVDEAVASAFVPNTDNKEFVYHINGDMADSNAENLTWMNLDEIEKMIVSNIRLQDTDEWADIPNSRPRCQVSHRGDVRVPARIVRSASYRLIEDRLLDTFKDEDGRTCVTVSFGGNRKTLAVDDLVMEAFGERGVLKCAG